MKILVIDDHVLIREALCGALATLRPEAAFFEEPDAAGALRRLEEHPDIALAVLDPGLPDRDGLDLLAELRERHPTLAVVVLSASETHEDIRRALALGALGFVPKSATRAVMLDAFRLILDGGVYVPPELLRRCPTAPAAPAAPSPACVPADALGLTVRQGEVLAGLMRGLSNKAICRELGIAEATVKNHVTEILRACGASNRTEAVIAAGALAGEREGESDA